MMLATPPLLFQTNCSTSPAATPLLKECSTMISPVSGTGSKELVSLETANGIPESASSIAFVYGTLKRGFGNHWLLQEQMEANHARFIGTAQSKLPFPLVCGPFQVPFLVNSPGRGYQVKGEIYQVDQHALELLDELEGTNKGHYVRSKIVVTSLKLDSSFSPATPGNLSMSYASQHSLGDWNLVGRSVEINAEAYFAATHYSSGLCFAPYIEAYTEKEAATYTRRKERPENLTFLEHIYAWIEQQKAVQVSDNECSNSAHKQIDARQ